MAHTVVTDQNFEEEVVQSSVPCLVDFWAPWCGPCQQLGPILDELGETYAGKIKVCKINVDEHKEQAQKMGVMGIPAVFFLKDGEVVDRFVGAKPKQDIIPLIEKVLA